MAESTPRPRGRLLLAPAGDPAGEDVGELLDVGARDHVLPALVLLAQAVDELGAQDVDLAVQDPPAIGDVHLVLGELPDQFLQLLVGERAEIGKGVHPPSLTATRRQVQARLERWARLRAMPSRV